MPPRLTCPIGKARAYAVVTSAIVAIAVSAATASAATLSVTSLADGDYPPVPGSLRAVVAAAAPGDTIDFAPDVRGTITLSAGVILVDETLTITGPGPDALTLCSAGGVPGGQPILQVDSSATPATVDVAISGLRLAGCKDDARGGAIYDYQDAGETLTLSRMTFQNIAGQSAVRVQGNGSLVVTASLFDGNEGGGSAGAIDNQSPAASSISDSVFRRNVRAVELSSSGSPASTTTITDSTFALNRTAGWGGGIYLNSGAPALRVSGSRFEGNTAGSYGGAIAHSSSNPLTVEDTQFTDNESDDGGAIYSDASADLTLTGTLFEGNVATFNGGSAFTREPNPSHTGTDTVTRSVFRQNTTRHSKGVIQYPYSGVGLRMTDSALIENVGDDGLGSAGLYWGGDELSIANSTFAGNTGLTSLGSTLYLDGGATSLDSVTIAGNTNAGGTAGIYDAYISPTVIRNSAIAGNSGDSGAGADCSGGTITFAGGAGTSILGDGAGCTVTGDTPKSGDAGLDALRPSTTTSGDETWIVPLAAGSPALDAGATDLTTDQRGIARPQGAAPDIGAVEMRPARLGVSLGAGQDRIALGAKVDLYAVARNTGDFGVPAAVLSFGLPPAFLAFAPPGAGATCAASPAGAACGLGVLAGEEERPVAVSAATTAAGSTTASATLAAQGFAAASAATPLVIVGAGATATARRPAGGICSRQIVRLRAAATAKSRITRPLARVSCRLTLNDRGTYAFRFSKGKGKGSWAILKGSTVAGTKTSRTRSTLTVPNAKAGRKLFLSALMSTKARSVPLTVSYTSSSGQVTPQTIK